MYNGLAARNECPIHATQKPFELHTNQIDEVTKWAIWLTQKRLLKKIIRSFSKDSKFKEV